MATNNERPIYWALTTIFGAATVASGVMAVLDNVKCPVDPEYSLRDSQEGRAELQPSVSGCTYITDVAAVEAELAARMGLPAIVHRPDILNDIQPRGDQAAVVTFQTKSGPMFMRVPTEVLTEAVDNHSKLEEVGKDVDARLLWMSVVSGILSALSGRAAMRVGQRRIYGSPARETASASVLNSGEEITILASAANLSVLGSFTQEMSRDTPGTLAHLYTRAIGSGLMSFQDEQLLIQEAERFARDFDEIKAAVTKPGGGGRLTLHGEEAVRAIEYYQMGSEQGLSGSRLHQFVMGKMVQVMVETRYQILRDLLERVNANLDEHFGEEAEQLGFLRQLNFLPQMINLFLQHQNRSKKE